MGPPLPYRISVTQWKVEMVKNVMVVTNRQIRDRRFLNLIRKSTQVLKLSGDSFAPSRMMIPVWADLNIWRETCCHSMIILQSNIPGIKAGNSLCKTLHSVVLDCSKYSHDLFVPMHCTMRVCSHPTTQRPTTATNQIQQNQCSTPYAIITQSLISWRWA